MTTAAEPVNRWHVVVALLADAGRESRRLAHLLSHWPADVRRHLIVDDVRRRGWVECLDTCGRKPRALSRRDFSAPSDSFALKSEFNRNQPRSPSWPGG